VPALATALIAARLAASRTGRGGQRLARGPGPGPAGHCERSGGARVHEGPARPGVTG
jgi:hypothetical protein